MSPAEASGSESDVRVTHRTLSVDSVLDTCSGSSVPDRSCTSSYSKRSEAPGCKPVAKAASGVQVAWKELSQAIPASVLEQSFLRSGSKMSSSCSGVYTAEMAMAVVSKVINDSAKLPWHVAIRSDSCFDTWFELDSRRRKVLLISTQ